MRGTCTKNKLGALGGAGPKKMALFFGLLVLVSLLMADHVPAAAREKSAAKPNILFILADDMRADDIKRMPALRSSLIEKGTTFENAFVTHSICCPSRASTLLGQYTHNHQVLGGDLNPEGGFKKFLRMGHESSTIATWLQSGGYRTVLIGKYLNGYPSDADPKYVPPGWDEWYGRIGGTDYFSYQLNENGKVVSYGNAEKDYQTDVYARKATDYVRRAARDNRPFFMYLAPSTPHSPNTPAPRHEKAFSEAQAPRPPSFDEKDVDDKPSRISRKAELNNEEIAKVDKDYRDRLRMLLSLDEMISGLVEELRASGELENTYIVFSSDNGYQLGEHRLTFRKGTAYEESIRVPLIVRGPGVPDGQVRKQLALNIDLAPTFAQLGGVPAPKVDGRSLAPVLTGGRPSAAWRSAFLVEHYRAEVPVYKAVRTEKHKYVEYGMERGKGERELYDLRTDPYELESLHETAAPRLVANLESRLEALKACAGKSCRAAENGP